MKNIINNYKAETVQKIEDRIVIHRNCPRDENRRFIISASKHNKTDDNFDFLPALDVDHNAVDLLAVPVKGDLKPKKNKGKGKKTQLNDKVEKKARKKSKKKVKAASAKLNYENKPINNGSIMSEIIRNKECLKVVNQNIYAYDKKVGFFKLCDRQGIATALCHYLDKHSDFLDKVTSSELTECYKMLLVRKELQSPPLGDGVNTPYILCKNGVVNLEELTLHTFSPKYEFTTAINAEYDKDAVGDNFKKFLDFVTDGNKELKHLLQEVTGYILSNYSCMRSAFMFSGPRGTGKSLYLSILRELLGMENVSSVNLQDLESEYYRAAILKAKVNIAPDIPAEPIRKEISTFKSLTSNLDVISGRDPREKPIQRVCNTRLVFGSNENIQLIGVSAASIEAFFDRMVYLPFRHQVSDAERDPNLQSLLLDERNYIFTWACKGMKRVIENGFKFSRCDVSLQMKAECWGKYCPEQVFCREHIEIADDDTYASSKEITSSFEDFCKKVNASVIPAAIKGYLENTMNIPKLASKKRIDANGHITSKGNPISVYQGIRLI